MPTFMMSIMYHPSQLINRKTVGIATEDRCFCDIRVVKYLFGCEIRNLSGLVPIHAFDLFFHHVL